MTGEWGAISPRHSPSCALGRPSEVDLREVLNAILFIAVTRCQCRKLPKEFPPYSTVQGYSYAWRDEGRWVMIRACPQLSWMTTATRRIAPRKFLASLS